MAWHYVFKTDFQSRVMIFLSKHATFSNSDQFALVILRDNIHNFNLIRMSYDFSLWSYVRNISASSIISPHIVWTPQEMRKTCCKCPRPNWSQAIVCYTLQGSPFLREGWRWSSDDFNPRFTFDDFPPHLKRHKNHIFFWHPNPPRWFMVMMNPPSSKPPPAQKPHEGPKHPIVVDVVGSGSDTWHLTRIRMGGPQRWLETLTSNKKIWVLKQKWGWETPQIINFNGGFQKTSPSILGGLPPLFLETPIYIYMYMT